MNRHRRLAPAAVLLALTATCAPPPEDDGTVLTLPPTTAATPSTSPPVSMAATIQLRISGITRKVVPLDQDNVCLDDRAGTLNVHGAAADGTVLDLTVSNPAVGRYPLAVNAAPAPGAPRQATVTKLSLRLGGKDYTRPSAGEISIADSQARKATVVVQSFAENPAVKMTADWSCAAPAPAPAARP